MLKNIKAVIFDLDGTLVDSMWVWKQIDKDYCKKIGVAMPSDLQKSIEGFSMRETAIYFKERFSIADSVEDIMKAWNEMAMQTYAANVEFKKGAKDFLTALKKRQIKTGIATSNSPELLGAVAEHLSLNDYIDCFLTGNEVAHGKPYPDIYLAVADRLGVKPCECLVFEDILPGIQAGLSAGMQVCAVFDEYSRDVTEEKINLANYYIEDFTEIDDVMP